MLEINVTVKCPDLLLAATAFAAAIKGTPVPTPEQAPAPTPAPAPVAAPAVPLAPPPAYTVEQLAHAGADLYTRDPAKGAQAQALLTQFGVQAVTELPPERYGEFATALRGLGANI